MTTTSHSENDVYQSPPVASIAYDLALYLAVQLVSGKSPRSLKEVSATSVAEIFKIIPAGTLPEKFLTEVTQLTFKMNDELRKQEGRVTYTTSDGQRINAKDYAKNPVGGSFRTSDDNKSIDGEKLFAEMKPQDLRHLAKIAVAVATTVWHPHALPALLSDAQHMRSSEELLKQAYDSLVNAQRELLQGRSGPSGA